MPPPVVHREHPVARIRANGASGGWCYASLAGVGRDPVKLPELEVGLWSCATSGSEEASRGRAAFLSAYLDVLGHRHERVRRPCGCNSAASPRAGERLRIPPTVGTCCGGVRRSIELNTANDRPKAAAGKLAGAQASPARWCHATLNRPVRVLHSPERRSMVVP